MVWLSAWQRRRMRRVVASSGRWIDGAQRRSLAKEVQNVRSDGMLPAELEASEAAPTTQEDGGTYFSLYRFFSQSTYFLVWDSRGYPTLVMADAKQFPEVFKKGQWVHLCGTWNGDEIRFYVNGQLQGATRVSTPRVLRSLGPRFRVGGANRANVADTVLDELRLFNRALTTAEVNALYHHTLSASPDAQEVTAVRLTTAKKVRVDVNAIGHSPSEAGKLAARVVLSPRTENRILQEVAIARFRTQHEVAEFNTAELPPGEYRAIIPGLERELVGLHGEDDEVLRPGVGEAVGGADPRHVLAPVHEELHPVIAQGGQVGAAGDGGDVLPDLREPHRDEPTDGSGAHDADPHGARSWWRRYSSPSLAASPMRCSFPVGPRGISRTKTILRGTLKCATCRAANSFSS